MNTAAQILELYRKAPLRNRLMDALIAEKCVPVKGVVGALQSFLVADCFDHLQRQVICLCPDAMKTESVKEDLDLLVGDDRVCLFPDNPKSGLGSVSVMAREARQKTLEILAEREPAIVVAHASAFLKCLAKPGDFRNDVLHIAQKAPLAFESTIQELFHLGFVREARVEQSGEMSVRGGIIDMYPYSAEQPYRIEFWGDTVESVRRFDPDTQRSTGPVQELKVFPQEIEAVATDDPALFNANLVDYIADDAVIVLQEPELLKKWLHTNGPVQGASPEDEGDKLWAEIAASLRNYLQIQLVSIGNYGSRIDFKARSQEPLDGSLKRFKNAVGKLTSCSGQDKGKTNTLFFLTESAGQAQRLDDIFSEEGIVAPGAGIARGFCILGCQFGGVYRSSVLRSYQAASSAQEIASRSDPQAIAAA
jgi:hypothetical protein